MAALRLDADVVIDLLREHAAANIWLRTFSSDGLLYVSGIAAGEVVYGCQNSHELTRTQSFLATLPILWPEPEDVRAAVESLTAYKLSHGLGFLDAITASIAVRHDLPLATFNARHFQPLPNLRLATPYAR